MSWPALIAIAKENQTKSNQNPTSAFNERLTLKANWAINIYSRVSLNCFCPHQMLENNGITTEAVLYSSSVQNSYVLSVHFLELESLYFTLFLWF